MTIHFAPDTPVRYKDGEGDLHDAVVMNDHWSTPRDYTRIYIAGEGAKVVPTFRLSLTRVEG